MRRFSKAFLVGFLGMIPLWVFLFHFAAWKLQERLKTASASAQMAQSLSDDRLDETLLDGLPPSLTNSSIRTAQKAKATGLFWAGMRAPNEQMGAAIDLRTDPKVFQSLFPGYPDEMRKDQPLWKIYFTREFLPRVFDSGLSEKSGIGIMVALSWTGCFDIYERYGADVLVFGSSEVYRSIIPELLFARVHQSTLEGLSNPRILFCAVNNMLPETVTLSAEQLAELNPKKVKAVIWGVSYWTLFLREPESKEIFSTHQSLYAAYKASKQPSRLKTFLHSRISHAFPNPSWNAWCPVTLQSFSLAKESPPDQDPEFTPERGYVPADQIESSEAVASIAERVDIKNEVLDTASTSDCDLRSRKTTFQSALSALKRISEKQLLYITTPSPIQTKRSPPCFMAAVQKFIGSRMDDTLSAVTASWEDYGLRYTDHLYPSPNPKFYFIDGNHTNYQGAKRVTEQIADKLVDVIQRQTSVKEDR